MRRRGALGVKASKHKLAGMGPHDRPVGQGCPGGRPRRALTDHLACGAEDEAGRLGLFPSPVLPNGARAKPEIHRLMAMESHHGEKVRLRQQESEGNRRSAPLDVLSATHCSSPWGSFRKQSRHCPPGDHSAARFTAIFINTMLRASVRLPPAETPLRRCLTAGRSKQLERH